MRHVEHCREHGVERVIVSIKSTDVPSALAANKLFAERSDVPLHVGITEAGDPTYGAIKLMSFVGMAHSIKLPKLKPVGVPKSGAQPKANERHGDEEPELVGAAD